ncbi:MAG: response regulator [Thermohalobaculum sp.]|nr:response regulator [Thermohalobaculum sp.]
MAKILVVDDDDSLRRVLEYNMAEEGHEVATAASGEEALQALERTGFDAVVTERATGARAEFRDADGIFAAAALALCRCHD